MSRMRSFMRLTRIILTLILAIPTILAVPSIPGISALVGWAGAGGSAYIGSAATQPPDINMSNNAGVSQSSSLKLDSLGNPCIAWQDMSPGNWEICFTKWNGSGWVNAAGATLGTTNGNASNNSGMSVSPSLALDSFGNPCIAWTDTSSGNEDVHFARWNGTGWVNSAGTALTVANSNVSNNVGGSYYPSLVIDSSGNPNISWTDNGSGNWEIYFSRWNGANWINSAGATLGTTNGNISNNSGFSQYSSLKLDTSGKPCIAWYDDTPGNWEIYYSKFTGSNWVNITGAVLNTTNANMSNNAGASQYCSLALDSTDNPCIAWHDFTPGNFEIYFARWNGTGWVNITGALLNTTNANLSNNAGASQYPSLSIDSSNRPCIAWQDQTPGNFDIYFARWNGASWVNVAGTALNTINGNVSSNSASSQYPSLAIDSSNNPNIAWQDPASGNNEIYFVEFANAFDGTFSITKSVDTDADGNFIDSGKTVNAGGTLAYRIDWRFNQGRDPLETPYLYDTIPEGTTYIAGSTSPNANLSHSLDGGATWIPGEPPNGSPAGTMLRWSIAANSWVGAAGSAYSSSALPQPYDINASGNASTSTRSSLEIDSSGNPCIAWMDTASGNSEIMFAKWNGTAWTNAAGLAFTMANGNVSNNTGGSTYPSLVLDQFDRPCIAWTDSTPGNTEIYFARWNGSAWMNAGGSALTATNGNVSNDTDTSQSPSLAVDGQGNPHIAWCNWMSTDYEILYTKWNGSGWVNASGSAMTTTNANFTNDAENNYQPILKLDSSGNPWIAWYITPVTNYEIMLGRWNGSAWVNVSGSALTVASANVSNNAGISFEPSLELDAGGRPCIAWYDNTGGNFDIYFARWNGSTWVTAGGAVLTATNANCSNNSGSSNLPKLALDSKGYPHIAWYDDTLNPGTNSIFYIKWNGSAWVNVFGLNATPANSNVSSTTYRTYFADLELNSHDIPYISWDQFAPTNPDIYFVRFGIDRVVFSFSVKVDNPPTILAFCNKASFRHLWDKGIATESNEICNSIDYNFTGTFTLGKSVDANSDGKYTDSGTEVNSGTKLSYKIDWKFDNPNNDPLFGAYVYDTVPPGTKYATGSSPTLSMSYSMDNGATWIGGEPPNGSPAGTRLRWKVRQPGWTNSKDQPVNSINPNVSNNTGVSDFPSLAVNGSGEPYIAWSDDVSGITLVYYTKWNGSQWVNAAGLPFSVANGNVGGIPGGDPTLALDPVTGYPWIAFQSNAILFSNLEIHIVKWDGTRWTNAAGMPVTLLNSNVSNNAGLSWYPSHQLALDGNRYPCFVWKDNSSGSWQSYFARWNGTNWVNVSGTVLNATNGSLNNNIVDPSFWPTLILDGSDNPCIAWDSNITGNSEVYFGKWNGTQWVNATGNPLTLTNGNVSNNTGLSLIPYMAINRLTGHPSITWSDNTPGNYEIYYAKWNGSAWLNISGASLTSTNGNVSNNAGNSSLLSSVLDGGGQPCISWEDDTSGNSEICFARWDGNQWANASHAALTSSNCIINLSPSRSWFPSLAFNPVTNNPNIAWLDRTPGSNEVYFAKWTEYRQSFAFSVTIDKPFTNQAFSPICNIATFSHVFDKGNPTVSNSACVDVKGMSKEVKTGLTVRKTSKSMQYSIKDTLVFSITVSNTGDTIAENIILTDIFPRELEFVSSVPSGSAGASVVKFSVGSLAPKTSASFTLKFKLSPKVAIEDCLTLINEAQVSSGKLTDKDLAAFRICTPKAPCPLYIETKWSGLARNVGKAGQVISCTVVPMCGSSPYEAEIDWGDGTKVMATIKGSGQSHTFDHTYSNPGEYKIKITVSDAYLATRLVEKIIKIE